MQVEHRLKSIRPQQTAWRFTREDVGVMDQEQYNHALGIYARWLVQIAVMQSQDGQPEVTGSTKLSRPSLTSEGFNRTVESPITVNTGGFDT